MAYNEKPSLSDRNLRLLSIPEESLSPAELRFRPYLAGVFAYHAGCIGGEAAAVREMRDAARTLNRIADEIDAGGPS